MQRAKKDSPRSKDQRDRRQKTMQQMWQIKEMIALAMLAICAYTDIKERNIYLFPLIVSTTGAVAVSVVSFMCAPADEEAGILIGDLMIPVLAGVFIIICVRAAKRHVGIGDGYLMAALGMIIGVRSNVISMVAGLFAASIYACIILIKKGKISRFRRRSIPFAPFVMTGYMLVLINGL